MLWIKDIDKIKNLSIEEIREIWIDEKIYIIHNDKIYIKFSYLLTNRENIILYKWRWKYKTVWLPIIYFIDYENKNEFIIIPPNFNFDFNSSPRFFRFIVDKDEFISALIHDFLYKINQDIEKEWVTYHLGMVEYNSYNLTLDDIFDKARYITRTKLLTITRKWADMLWLRNALLEEELLRWEIPRLTKMRIYLWYYWLRLFWFLNYKK